MQPGPGDARDKEAAMFKRILISILAGWLLVLPASAAQTGRSAVGLILFEPTGLTGKVWMSRSAAIAGGLGWSAEKDHYLHLHVDFLFYRHRLASDRNLDLDFYLGAGAKLVFRDFNNAWLRFPAGLDFLLRKSPLNFFFEIVPSSNFSDLKVFGAIGFRYLFQP
jgi:hypothetical protein